MIDAEILRDQLFIVQNFVGLAGEHATSGVENNRQVGDIQRKLAILLDQNDRLALVFQTPDGSADLSDDQRRQAFRWFVEQKHPRISHQGSSDRQHLLFAPGKRAGKLGVAFAQPRKHVVDPIDIPGAGASGPALLRHDEIFPNRERGEDSTALWHKADPKMRDSFGIEALDRFAEQLDLAFTRLQKADDGRDAGGLSRAVASQ